MKKMIAAMSVVAMCAAAGLSVAGEPMKANPGKTMSKPVATTPTATVPMPIIETAAKAGTFNTLAKALEVTGLIPALSGEGPFTVFAPTDDAFAKLGAEKLAQLMLPENREMLKSVLTYHVVPGKVMAADVTKLTTATTLNGQRFNITTKNGVMVDNAKVVTTDIKCTNGVIHVIDTVIMPETRNIVEVAGAAGSFKTLTKLIEAAGLTSTLTTEGPFTVFAPTDEAFAKLPGGVVESLLKPENKDQLVGILTYHVVPGWNFADQVTTMTGTKTVQGTNVTFAVQNGKAMINNATITKTDIETRNGVIHVIDTVIMPKAN